MSVDPRIICFKHCSSTSVFCKEVPERCPLCNSTISDYVLQPFRLPYPFVRADECPVSVVMRPSRGDFLNDYKITADLHIGIVDSNGHVYEFDTPGVIINDISNWQNCLALKIVTGSAWTDHWDGTIDTICKDDKWSSKNYNQETLNCFNFVLEFLKQLKYKDAVFSSKEEFCSNFIIPKIQDALKFVTIYRRLKDDDHFFAN